MTTTLHRLRSLPPGDADFPDLAGDQDKTESSSADALIAEPMGSGAIAHIPNPSWRERLMKDRKTYRQNIVAAVGVALMAAGLTGTIPGEALADGSGYTFKKLATIPGPAPGGGMFTFDFEPYAINAGGNVAFVADLDAGSGDIGEGVFVSRQGRISQIARVGLPAPGGGMFEIGALGHAALNNAGDGAFAFILDANVFQPFGLNSGLFRFSLLNEAPTAVVTPGVTPAPTPAGAKFAGVYFNSSLNNRGDLVFNGVVPGLVGPPKSSVFGVGVGVFKAGRWNHIASVVVPGDKAPGGGVFDDAIEGWINDPGDIAFDAHVKGEECIDLGGGFELVCGSSVYKMPKHGKIQSIAHQGDPAPGGGTYRQAFGPVMNDAGDLVFVGDLTPPPDHSLSLGVFRHSKGVTTPVVLPGQPLPGGGNFATTAGIPYQYYLNNAGDITFVAALDTVHGGVADTGLYLVSHGKTQVVARTGTFIPRVGTVADVNSPGFVGSGLQAGGIINDRGQIFFEVVLTDGTGVLLVATPRGY